MAGIRVQLRATSKGYGQPYQACSIAVAVVVGRLWSRFEFGFVLGVRGFGVRVSNFGVSGGTVGHVSPTERTKA